MEKMMKIYHILYIGLALMLLGCSTEDARQEELALPEKGELVITSSVNGFEGEECTRTNIAGNQFSTGDWIKLKIICPYVSNTLIGETTWGGSSDALWLLKWSGSNWVVLESSVDKVDISSHYSYGYNNVFGQFEAQQTPYVYTASTWNENVIFLAANSAGGRSLSRYSQYSYIFHANQSEKADYLKNDLLWGQTYMQTGSYNVHLSFNHVMACLKISVSGVTLSSSAVVTLEGMPDIDQQEVVVGDYYAEASKVNSKYGYQDKCKCDYANNGKVLGVAMVQESTAKAIVNPLTGPLNDTRDSHHTTGTVVDNDGVYIAYNNSGTFYLIVPPCKLTEKATFMIRDGAKRYSYTLQQTTFEQGKQYPVTITLTDAGS